MAKGKFALGAIIGAAIGAVAGILAAPKSGKETRKDIKKKADDAKKEAEIAKLKAQAEFNKRKGQATQKAEGLIDDAKQKKEELRTRVNNAAEAAKKDPNKKD